MFPAPRLLPRLFTAGTLMLGGLFGLALSAFSNDGGLAMGGSPRLLTAHPSVAMTSEVINIAVAKEKVTVDCQFVFTNNGPACKVRMGFPDEGHGANDPDEEYMGEDDLLKTPPRTTFLSFQSFVDGTPTPTKLIRAHEEGHYWHTKMVVFPAHSVRRVHDVYTQRVGGGIAVFKDKGTGWVSQIAYVLHTGASWHGNIGRTEINVTFKANQLSGPPHFLPLKQVSTYDDGRELNVASVEPNTIVWQGPCAPRVKGNALQFVRTNWHPTPRDDLKLTYNYKRHAAN